MPRRPRPDKQQPTPPSENPAGALAWMLGVAAVAIGASIAGLGNELVQDDVSLLVENDRLHGLGQWREILTNPYWPPPHSPDLYRPITSLLLALEYSVGGGGPLPFRFTSYLLYAGLSIGVFSLARRLLPLGIAGAVALFFAAHPVHVEAVALAVGQSELLVGLFGTLMAIRYLDRRLTGEGDLSLRDWAFLAFLYAMASLSKEQGLVLPAILAALEISVLRLPRLRRLAPGYLLLGLAGAVVLLARQVALGGTVTGSFTAAALQGLDFGGRALTMLAVVPEWVRLLVWPAHLQADYSPREIVASAGFGGPEAIGAALIAIITLGAWFARRRAPAITFGLLWTAIALLPVSNLVVPTGIVLAERTLLLPSLGVGLAVGGALGGGAAWPIASGLSRWSAQAGRLALAAITLALVVRSAARQRDWRNDAVFRTESVEDAPLSWRTRLSYGSYLFEAGRRDSALDHYRRALGLAPEAERWRVRNDLAEHYFAAEETAPAVEQLRASLSEAPEQEGTRHYLVLGLLSLGAYPEAAAQADSALARGGAAGLFTELKLLADSARRLGVPPGGIRIRVRRMGQ